MIIHQNRFSCLFGDRHSPFQLPALAGNREEEILQEAVILKRAASSLFLPKLILLKQTHSSHGYLLTDQHSLESFSLRSHEGDYIITTLPSVGIGIATADCLPILIYDPVHHAGAAIHAGWKGLIGNIIPIALRHMAVSLGTAPGTLVVLIGPSAGQCCYEVQPSFIAHLTSLVDYDTLLLRKNNRLYFDLPGAAYRQLRAAGIPPATISRAYHQCTICTPSFYSYRRNPAEGYRQVTLLCLNEKYA